MKEVYFRFATFVFFVLFVISCASVGSPSGGPKDITPPRLEISSPIENALNVSQNRIEIKFNELVSLKSPSEKVLVSPPQKIPPEAKSIGNKIVVILNDTLEPNQTYTIDFTDAIVDYNEGNKFGDYALNFSTGSVLDSFRISGTVIDASNLNPLSGILIGTHEGNESLVFKNKPFGQITRSGSDGAFVVKGLPQVPFKIFALGDKNRDYMFDQPGEPIAFNDSVFFPRTELCTKADTIWKDSITVDTIILKNMTCFFPNDVVLNYYQEAFQQQYLKKKERVSRNRIQLFFAAPVQSMPKVTLLNQHQDPWYELDKSPTNDTLTYWISDTMLVQTDSLYLQMEYQMTDTLNQLVWKTDTLNFFSRPLRKQQKEPSESTNKKEEEEKAKPVVVNRLSMNVKIPYTMDIFSRPFIEFSEPVQDLALDAWHLMVKKDTTWQKCTFKINRDSVRIRRYYVDATWDFGKEYKIKIDSGKIRGLYDAINDSLSLSFRVKSESDYSRLTVFVEGLNDHGFVELLNKSDEVVRRLPLVNATADFKYLLPGVYYMRAIRDKNNNGKWDPGAFEQSRQPESVFYNSRSIKLRENWDVEEVWDVNELPIWMQKPKELIPKTKISK